MSRPRFSEMLVNRRRQLGLSITQASNVLRLKEHILIAFEEGDFDNMPKSGYAQGMLSSYARYLGLNTRAVVRQFSSDLYDWDHRRGRSVADEAIYELPGARGQSDYQGTRGLLPTSGGFAGDLAGFATTSPVRSRQQSSPLVRNRHDGPSYHDDLRRQGRAGQQRPYTARDVESSFGQRRASASGSARAAQRRSLPSGRAHTGAGRGREGITTRRVTPSEYTDDLRYEDARPYEAASTRTGRASSRNIARIDRPNVQRRRPASQGRPARERTNRERGRGGLPGIVEWLLLDMRRSMVLVSVLAAAFLILLIIFSVNSCVRGAGSDARTVAVSSAQAEERKTNPTTEAAPTSTTGSEAAEKAAKDAAEAKAAKDRKEASTETVVEVSVASGDVSWVEIKNDGQSVVAEQVTGPWSQKYTVTESISIQVSNTTAVTVTKNGTPQSFESKASGIGSLTIQGTKPAKSDDQKKEGESEAAASTAEAGAAAPETQDTSATAGAN